MHELVICRSQKVGTIHLLMSVILSFILHIDNSSSLSFLGQSGLEAPLSLSPQTIMLQGPDPLSPPKTQ